MLYSKVHGSVSSEALMRKEPKVGDLVTPVGAARDLEQFDKPGLVIDTLELEGFNNLEVIFDDGHRAWFTDLEVKVLNE